MMINRLRVFYDIIANNLFVLGIAWRISKLRFIIKIIVTILSAILPVINIMIVRHIISLLESDLARAAYRLNQLFIVIIGLSIMQLFPKLFATVNTALIEPMLASKINFYINKVFIEKASEFEYKNFEDPLFYDKYVRALKQSESIVHTVFNAFFQLIGSAFALLSLFALVISMDWIVILFVVFSVVVGFVHSLVSGMLNFKTSQILTPINRRINYVKKILYNPVYAKDIKCNNAMSTGARYFSESFDSLLLTIRKFGHKMAFMGVIIIILSTISSTAMMLYLVSRVWLGVHNIANFSALLSSSGQLEGTMNSFFNTISGFYKNSLDIDNFKFVYFYQREQTDGSRTLNSDTALKIEIKNLFFKYPNSTKYALKNISLKIMPGEKVSLVGHNGSGKTTLIKLLLGLYEPESGEILINDVDMKQYKRDDLQKQLGVVFQDYQIFAFTIKENIAFEDEVSDKARGVLDKLDVSKVITNLPKGYNTPLSKEFDEHGTLMSGGEAQKICIARAVNKDAGLYIFDEPTSSLDPWAESKMNRLLYEITDRTVIFISHRLTATVAADAIFMLSDGELVENGSHNELMFKRGMYYEFFMTQAENYISNQ